MSPKFRFEQNGPGAKFLEVRIAVEMSDEHRFLQDF